MKVATMKFPHRTDPISLREARSCIEGSRWLTTPEIKMSKNLILVREAYNEGIDAALAALDKCKRMPSRVGRRKKAKPNV